MHRLLHAQVSKIHESRAIEQQKRTTNDETSSRLTGPAGGLLSIDSAEARVFCHLLTIFTDELLAISRTYTRTSFVHRTLRPRSPSWRRARPP